jgi:hypothetical protein
MISNPYTIQSQEISPDGYYPPPPYLTYMDRICSYNESEQKLISAIIMTISECFNEKFETLLFHKKGFVIRFLHNRKFPLFIIPLERYSLIGNKLILT